jgi:hypothetical protein
MQSSKKFIKVEYSVELCVFGVETSDSADRG